MSAATKDLNPLVYIDKIQRFYPCGVSVSSILTPVAVTCQSPTSLDARVVCMVVRDGAQDGEAPDANETLLAAICHKGLQLSADEYLVERCDVREFSAELLANRIQHHSPAVVIVFGGGDSPGTVTTLASTQVLYAHALEKIASDLSIKKEFWRQLQESVLPIVKERPSALG